MADGQESVAQTPENGAAPPPTVADAPDEPVKLVDPLSPEAVEEEFAEELADAEEQARGDGELEEFEWNTRKVKVSKEVKKDLDSMLGDYTRGKQEVAQQRRDLEATAKRAQEQIKAAEADLELRAEYMATRKQLDAFGNVDWQTWSATDAAAANAAFMQYQQLRDNLGRLETDLRSRAQKRSAEAQQAQKDDLAKRLHDTHEWAKTNVKGWTPDTDKQVIDFAIEQGVEFADLQGAMNPTIYKILNLARLGAQVLSKPAASSTNQAQPTPLKVVGAKANAPVRKSLADASMEEYVASRKKQGYGQKR